MFVTDGEENDELDRPLAQDETAELVEMFKLVDKDGNQTISSDEFVELLSTLQIRPTKTEINLIFQEIESPSTHEIHFNDFLRFMTSQQLQSFDQNKLLKSFKQLSNYIQPVNKKGKIKKQDLVRGMAELIPDYLRGVGKGVTAAGSTSNASRTANGNGLSVSTSGSNSGSASRNLSRVSSAARRKRSSAIEDAEAEAYKLIEKTLRFGNSDLFDYEKFVSQFVAHSKQKEKEGVERKENQVKGEENERVEEGKQEIEEQAEEEEDEEGEAEDVEEEEETDQVGELSQRNGDADAEEENAEESDR